AAATETSQTAAILEFGSDEAVERLADLHQARKGRARLIQSPRRRWPAQSPNSICQSGLALLWQILSEAGFPDQVFNYSGVVGFWRGRPWLAGRWIGKKSLDVGSSRFWIGWVIKRGGKCARSTYRG